jgi:hypothetical protein
VNATGAAPGAALTTRDLPVMVKACEAMYGVAITRRALILNANTGKVAKVPAEFRRRTLNFIGRALFNEWPAAKVAVAKPKFQHYYTPAKTARAMALEARFAKLELRHKAEDVAHELHAYDFPDFGFKATEATLRKAVRERIAGERARASNARALLAREDKAREYLDEAYQIRDSLLVARPTYLARACMLDWDKPDGRALARLHYLLSGER